jgi:hypothetical protein
VAWRLYCPWATATLQRRQKMAQRFS